MFILSLCLRIAGVVLTIHGLLLLLSIKIVPEFIPGGWPVPLLAGLACFGCGVLLFLKNRGKAEARKQAEQRGGHE